MSTRNPEMAVTLGVSVENQYLDAVQRRWWLDNYGTSAEWLDACDRADAAEWLYAELGRIFPGVYDCHHGMRLQDCVCPVSHYGPDPF